MEVRAFAEQVLLSAKLDDKLQKVRTGFTDNAPGLSVRLSEPVRPENLQFAGRREAPAMPHSNTFADAKRRAIAHHIMANHELQALEVMAWTLLAFPEAPTEFRLGLARIMQDEQRHTLMHIERARALGVEFGSLKVNCYIWKKALSFASLLEYLAGLPLTFEGRNLDHTQEFEAAFTSVGDLRSAAVMRQIHRDEIEHVAFGYSWLCQLKPADATPWETYCRNLSWPLRADKSVGDSLHLEPRRLAGLPDPFLAELVQSGGNLQKPIPIIGSLPTVCQWPSNSDVTPTPAESTG